ncbi:MAG: hypothetical protein IJ071_10860 [Ruminococcus sp.]|nr:hypothetical protein [Ruminococcus sp.]
MSRSDKDLDQLYKELEDYRDSHEDEGSRLLKFFVGLLMLAGGLFMIFQNISVSSSWGRGGYFLSFGNFNLANGMIMLPIIIGIGMLFTMKRKIFGWIVLAIGVVFVLLSVLLTTSIHWRTTNAYIFIIMFGMTAAGAGLVLRELFRKDPK